MRRFFHPPPPASSLTRFDRHCYNHLTSHHLTSLLLVLCLALGLVACQSGGSSASSANNDETISVKDGSDSSGNDDSDIGDDISFADLSDDTKTIIGMREFLLTVTFDNLTDKESLTFIVGETSTAPEWSSVQNNPVRITRAFNNENLKTRRIYFSATEKLTDVSYDADGNASISGKVIDLSQAGSQSEADYTKAQAAGIMAPSTSYYVYVYDSRGALVKQQTVTTEVYPTSSSFTTPPQVGAVGDRTSDASFDEYFWGMDAWRDANGVYQIVKDVEVKKGEVFFLPLRMRSPIDWDLGSPNSYCTGGVTKSLSFFNAKGTATPVEIASLTTSKGIPITNMFSSANSLALFTNILSTSEIDETFDLMYLAQVRKTGEEIFYSVQMPCIDTNGISNLDSYKLSFFTLITE